MATQDEVGEHLDLSSRSVRDLRRRGVFHAAGRGGYDLDECRIAYVRYLRERAAGRASDEADEAGFDLQLERARLAREQADNVSMKNAQLRGDLVAAADVTAAVVSVITLAKAKLARIPVKLGAGNTALRDRLAAAIEDALDDLSLSRVEEDLGGGGDADEEGEADEDEDD